MIGVGLGHWGRGDVPLGLWAGVVVMHHEGAAADGKFIAGQERGFFRHALAVDECARLRAQVPDHQAFVAVVDHALVMAHGGVIEADVGARVQADDDRELVHNEFSARVRASQFDFHCEFLFRKTRARFIAKPQAVDWK